MIAAALFIAAALASGQPAAEEEEEEPGIAPAAPIVFGGTPYRAAFDRAQMYEGNAAVQAWHANAFGPALNDEMTRIYLACTPTGQAPLPFVLVVSFDREGVVDGVFADKKTRESQCMAERFANLTAPRPPVPDFAEEVRIVP